VPTRSSFAPWGFNIARMLSIRAIVVQRTRWPEDSWPKAQKLYAWRILSVTLVVFET